MWGIQVAFINNHPERRKDTLARVFLPFYTYKEAKEYMAKLFKNNLVMHVTLVYRLHPNSHGSFIIPAVALNDLLLEISDAINEKREHYAVEASPQEKE